MLNGKCDANLGSPSHAECCGPCAYQKQNQCDHDHGFARFLDHMKVSAPGTQMEALFREGLDENATYHTII